MAIITSTLVLGVLSVMFFAGMMTLFTPATPAVESQSVLKLDFRTPIYDDPTRNPFSDLGLDNLFSLEVEHHYALVDVLRAIEQAASDDRIEGIYLDLSATTGMGMATMEEIRNALLSFKTSGKRIVSYADTYTQGSYYLASVADRIYLNAQGSLSWMGMASGVAFYKGLLDKLGVQVEAIRHGSFKSAVEPFIREQMSPENRLQMDRLIGSLWGHIVGEIAHARGLDSTTLQGYASQLAITDADRAVALKMVDSLCYATQVDSMWMQQTRLDSLAEQPRYVSLDHYIQQETTSTDNLSENKIAVVYVEGQIVDGKGREGLVGGNALASRIARIGRDKQVKAMVLRVNSPGGSALASEIIWHEVERVRSRIPVVVSMGNMAASGGYYVSCPADAILASPTTLTGSIGVFGLMMNGEKGLKEKLGITVDVVKSNPSADMDLTAFGVVGVRPMSDPERQFMQASVERVYTAFVDRVARGRNMSVAEVDRIGGGRVWTGADAQGVGLIDGFGGLKDAIALAADRAGVAEDFRIVSPEATPDRWTQLLDLLSVRMQKPRFEGSFGSIYAQYELLRTIFYPHSIQALTPYRVELE
ncbi:MAG: signal peptide peptidase SppA [Alistipes sp.]|nr:signal peptide peptidase SppA [Alistipes sp.]